MRWWCLILPAALSGCLGSQRSLVIDASQVRIGAQLPVQTIVNSETRIELPDGQKEVWFRTETSHARYTLTDWLPDGSSFWRYELLDWQIDQRQADGAAGSLQKNIRDEFPPVTFQLSPQGRLLALNGWDEVVQKLAPGASFFPIDTINPPSFVQIWDFYPNKKVRKKQKWSRYTTDEMLHTQKHHTWRLSSVKDSVVIVSGRVQVETNQAPHREPLALLNFQYQMTGSGHAEIAIDPVTGLIRRRTSVLSTQGVAMPLIRGTAARPVVFSVRTEEEWRVGRL